MNTEAEERDEDLIWWYQWLGNSSNYGRVNGGETGHTAMVMSRWWR